MCPCLCCQRQGLAAGSLPARPRPGAAPGHCAALPAEMLAAQQTNFSHLSAVRRLQARALGTASWLGTRQAARWQREEPIARSVRELLPLVVMEATFASGNNRTPPQGGPMLSLEPWGVGSGGGGLAGPGSAGVFLLSLLGWYRGDKWEPELGPAFRTSTAEFPFLPELGPGLSSL